MLKQQPTTRLPARASAAPGADPLAGSIIDGRYEVLEPLGRGGMATVYRARDRRLGRLVALKILDVPDREAAREDRVLAGLAHPHIVGVHDSGATPDGRSFLVLELVAGTPAGRLAPLPPARALRIAEQVAAALAHAHARGIVHCDVTPQNVLVGDDGVAKLADFGVASPDAAPTGETVRGAAAYVAPERLRGAPVAPTADIYALGATLYQLLAGRPPYPGDDPLDVVAQVSAGPPTPLAAVVPAVPLPVAALVARAMARDEEARFPSADALHRALVDARRALAAPPARRRAPWRAVLAATLVALLLLVGSAVFLASRPISPGGERAAATIVAPEPPTPGSQPTPTIAVAGTALPSAPPPPMANPASVPALPAAAPAAPSPTPTAIEPDQGEATGAGEGNDKGDKGDKDDKDEEDKKDKDREKKEPR